MVLTVALLMANFLGLWSFKFVRYKNHIQYSTIKAIYSISLFSIVLSLYGIIGAITFLRERDIFFGSFTLRLAVMIYTYSVLMSFAIAYLNQHWLSRKIEIAYIKCKDIVDAMSGSLWTVDFSSYLIEIILKTIVFDIINGMISYNNMIHSSVVLRSKPILTIVIILPVIVGRWHINMFHGAVLAINVYMRKLNCHLIDIVTKASYVNGEDGPTHKYFRMDNYCCFSDEIDKISALYFKIVDATKSLNSIFSMGITVWNITTILILTVQLLHQFISIIELNQEKTEVTSATLALYINGQISILLSSLDLLSTSNACQRIVNSVRCKFLYHVLITRYIRLVQVEQTANILHKTKISRDVDIRFRRSVKFEIFYK